MTDTKMDIVKKNPKVKTWTFTLNNYTNNDIQLIKDWEKNYLIFGKEVGESGTPHLQGVITFKKANRLSALKKLHNRIHWEPCKERNAAINYCMKEMDYEIQDNNNQGERTDLAHCKQMIDNGKDMYDIAQEHFGDFVRYYKSFDRYRILKRKREMMDAPHQEKEVIWMYGPSGVGKSYKWHNELKGTSFYKCAVNNSGKLSFEDYDSEETLLIDEYRGQFPLWQLLEITGPYVIKLPGRNVSPVSSFNKVIILSCKNPLEVYENVKDENLFQLIRRCTRIILKDENGEFDKKDEMVHKSTCKTCGTWGAVCENFNLIKNNNIFNM